MEYEQILVERDDDVVVLTLNRPDRLNAWTPRMTAELIDAIEAADADPAVGAVVMTGAGRGFCAGADIGAVFDAQLQGDAAASVPQGDRDWVELIRATKPIVAAVNGPAIGMGLTMILPFDRIVVADGAKLSIRFVKLGLVPELASRCSCPLRCGWGAASDLMLSGRTVLPDEALALGVVDEVVAPEDGARRRDRACTFVRHEPDAAVAMDQAAADAERERDRPAARSSGARSAGSPRRTRHRSTRKRSPRTSDAAPQDPRPEPPRHRDFVAR